MYPFLIKCLFISTGAGFAPFYGMSLEAEILKNDRNSQYGRIDIVFGCRNRDEDFIFRNEIESFKQKGVYSEILTAFSRQDVILISCSLRKRFTCKTSLRKTRLS